MSVAGLDRELKAAWCGDEPAFARLGAEWNELLARSEADGFFLTWEWVSTWWRHFGAERDLWVLELRDGEGALRAVAPLFRRRARGRFGALRSVEFLGQSSPVLPDHLNFIVERGWEAPALAAVAASLAARSGEWDLLRLAELDRESDTVREFESAAASRGWRAHAFPSATCPYLPLPASWEELERGLRPGFRKDVRYLERRAIREGARWVSREEPVELEGGFAELARLHQLRMEDTDRGGNFRRPDYAAFHRDLMGILAPLGRLELRFLELEGRAAAAQYGFRYGRTFYYYQLGFDPAFGARSPGTVLLAGRLRELIGAGFREIDMLRGRGAYKYRWTSLDRTNHALVIRQAGWRGTSAWLSDLLAVSPPLILRRVLAPETFDAVRGAWRHARGRTAPRGPGRSREPAS